MHGARRQLQPGRDRRGQQSLGQQLEHLQFAGGHVVLDEPRLHPLLGPLRPHGAGRVVPQCEQRGTGPVEHLPLVRIERLRPDVGEHPAPGRIGTGHLGGLDGQHGHVADLLHDQVTEAVLARRRPFIDQSSRQAGLPGRGAGLVAAHHVRLAVGFDADGQAEFGTHRPGQPVADEFVGGFTPGERVHRLAQHVQHNGGRVFGHGGMFAPQHHVQSHLRVPSGDYRKVHRSGSLLSGYRRRSGSQVIRSHNFC